MTLEQEQAHTPSVNPLDTVPGGAGGGGGHGGASPPPPDGDSYLPDATPTPQAVAERANVMGHYAEDLMQPPVDAHALIGDLESKLTIDPNDKGKSLEALDQLAAAKKTEAHKQIEEHESKFDRHEEKAKHEIHEQAKEQVRQIKPHDRPHHEPHHGAPPTVSHPGPKLPAQQCGPVSKEGLKARVQETMTRELAELDTNYEKEKASLDRKVGNQLESLDDEKQKQVGKVGDRMGKGFGELQTDIAKRAEKNTQEIVKEQKGIDAEATTQNKSITDQGAADKARAEKEQQKQAELDKANADKRAAEIRARATTEATAALTSGSTRGNELLAAANARAAAVPENERATIVAEGKQRNVIALLEGQKRQGEILAKGEADAKSALEQGKRASEAMAHGGKAGAATYGDQVGASTKAGTDRVDGAAKKAGQDMAAVSATAVGNMQGAAAESLAKSAGSLAGAGAKMGEAQEHAKGVAEKEQTAALAKLKESYDSTKTKIESKGKAELEKIDKAKDGDLCKLEKEVSGDLKAMDQMAEQADTQMAGQVKLAERKVKIEVAKQKAAMRLAAQQAIAAINGFVVQAKLKIKAADKNTLKDIHGAAKVGHQAVLDTGKAALADVTKNNEAIVQKVTADGTADRAAMDAQAAASEAAMAKSAADTKGAIDQQVIDETLAVTGKNIQKKGWFDYTSDRQANTAMDALTSLPKDLQGKAVEKLPADQFKNLISEVPEKRREEFESLVDNTTDPERKLQLFAGYAKSKAHNDADRMKGDTGHWWSRNKQQKENERKDDVRQNIANTTDKEVDEEIAHLRALEKSGTPLTKEAVDELYKRKKLENEIEMKYNVNLTNETGNKNVATGPGASKDAMPQERAVWSVDELKEVQKGLSRLPADAVSGNDHLKEITRRGTDYEWDKATNQWTDSGVRAWHTSEGQIIINQGAAATPHGPHPRMSNGGVGIESDLSGDPARPGYDHANKYAAASSISGTLTHELGHDIAQKHPDILAKITASSDWQLGETRVDANGTVVNQEAELKAGLAAQGMTPAQITARLAKLQKSSSRYENIGGRQYNYNDYTGKLESFAEGTMPPEVAAAGDYDYMRSEPGEQFAELYSKIANAPTQAHQDLVSDPAKRTQAAQGALKAAQDALAATPGDAAAQKAVTDAQKALSTAQSNQTATSTQWTTMRNEVFHTNDAQTGASADLASHAGAAPTPQQQAILADFNNQAANCGTPDQIDQLKRDYQTRLDAAAKTP